MVNIMIEMLFSSRRRVDAPAEFLGEVTAASFITGANLATAIGLTTGTLINSTSPWLRFRLKGKELYVPRQPLRHTVSWETLYQLGAVYGDDTTGTNPSPVGSGRIQNARVTIGGKVYRVRLLKGSPVDPYPGRTGVYDPAEVIGSEWDAIFYPIVSNDTKLLSYKGPKLASYTMVELYLHYSAGYGGYNLTQETCLGLPDTRMVRASMGACYVVNNGKTVADSGGGWRPVLELIG